MSLRNRILPWATTHVPAQTEALLVVPVEEPVSLRAVQWRLLAFCHFDVLCAGIIDGALLRMHKGNVLDVIWTEVRDLRTGPLDEPQGLWQLVHKGAQQGDYLAAWVRNTEACSMVVRGHFIVGDPT